MPAPETRFAVLLFTDIVGSTELKARHGVPAYSEALRAHNGHFERIARECFNIRNLQSRGDGYFAEAGSIAEAVRFALLFEEAMREGPWGEVRLAVRFGIHAGEVGMLHQEDGTWIVGPAADLAARITDLAMGGQILLTRFPFDEARHFIREHPSVAGKTMPPLCWLAHGPYLLKGRDEPMDIFEVGAEGLAPLTAPPDGDKAKRAIRPGEEETLGWRPAVGLEIPGRTGWQLIERLGAGGFGEVWTGEHAKLHQRRAFKFCFDDERLRALKREVTLVRLLRSALGERDDIVHIHELKLDAPPFYLESDLAPHGNLLQWAESQGGLDKIPLAQRIALVAHTATALAAAHSIGVLHKDIKPTNILIFDGPGGEPRPRLVDFGIGTLADPSVLGEHGVTGAGFTRATIEHSTGTPTYSPPEYLAGKPYTIQGDIYGLGVLLYQLITAKPLDPLAQGWEREIADPLLREDIAACVDGDPTRRLPSAADLADRLLHLDQRRADILEKERLAREAAARAEAEAAARADRVRAIRFRKLATAFALLALVALTGGVLAWRQRDRAIAARNDAEIHRLAAEALALSNTNPMQALRLAVQATEHAQKSFGTPSPRVQESLARTLMEGRLLREIDSGLTEPRRFAVSTDGARAVAATGTRLSFLDLVSGRSVWRNVHGESTLTGVAISADGTVAVSAAKDGTVCLWGSEGRPLGPPWKIARGWVTALALSPDGQRLVTAEGDRCVHLRDREGRELAEPSEPHADAVRYVAFAADARYFAAASGEISGTTARLYASADNALQMDLKIANQRPTCLAFTPDSARLLVGGADRQLRFYPVSAAGGVTSPTPDRVIAFNPIYDRETVPEARAATFSSDGLTLGVLGTDNVVYFWHLAGKGFVLQPSYRIKAHDVVGLGFGGDSLRVHTISQSGLCGVWDLRSLDVLAPVSPGNGRVKALAFLSPTELLTSSETGFIDAWSWPGLRKTDSFSLRPRIRFDVAPSGRWLTAICEERAFWLMQRGTDGKWAKTPGIPLPGDGRAVALCEPIRRVAVACIRGVALYDFAGQRVWEDDSVEGSIEPAVAFQPQGMQWAHNRHDAATFVVRDAAGRVLAELGARLGSAPTSLVYSPDGRWLAAGFRRGVVEIYRTSALDAPPVTIDAAKSAITSLRFTPDSSGLAVGARDFAISVWQTDGTTRVPPYAAHATSVDALAFTADGRTLVSGGADAMIRCWAVDWRDWLDLAHRRLRAATGDEP